MVNQYECGDLADMLNKYDATPWIGLNQYIGALTGTAVGLFILSVGSLSVPRRLAPRAFLAALLIFQILLLIPYFILDSRRNGMIFKKLNGRDDLEKEAEKCKLQLNDDPKFYNYEGNGRSRMFEGFALIASSCVSGALASRLVYLSVLRSSNGENSEDGYGRRRTRRGRGRNLADIDALLLELRYEGPSPSAPSAPDKEEVQCAICLDEIVYNPPKTMEENVDDGGDTDNFHISQLHCSHMYHENCLRNWFRSTSAREYSCPMCKASVWADDSPDAEEAVDGDEESRGVGGGRGDIEADPAIDIEIGGPSSSGATPEIAALPSETSIACAQPEVMESDDFVVIPLPRDGP